MYFLLLVPLLLLCLPSNSDSVIVFLFFVLAAFAMNFTKRKLLINKTEWQFKKSNHKLIGILFSVLFCAFFAKRFYCQWLPSGVINRISSVLGIGNKTFIAVLTFFLSLLCVCCLYVLLNSIFVFLKKSNLSFLINKPFCDKKLSFIFITLFVLFFWYCQKNLPLWGNTDNYYISCVVNGLYSSDTYCCFLNPLLMWLVGAVGSVFTSSDAYVLIGECLMLTGIWCIFYLLSFTVKKKTLTVLGIVLVCLNYKLNILHAPFTFFSVLLAAIGITLIYFFIRKKASLVFSLFGTVYIVFSAMWRFEAFLLLIPFIGLYALIDIISTQKSNRKELIKKIGFSAVPVLICLLTVFAVKTNIASSAKYKDHVAYNSARSALVDYAQKDFEEIKDKLSLYGISENDYRCMNKMILLDTDIVTENYMKNIGNISEKSLSQKADYFIKNGIKTKVEYFKDYPELVIQVVIIFILTIVLLLSDISLLKKIGLFVSIAGVVFISSYYCLMGHLPLYLIQSIMVGIYLYLLCLCSAETKIKIKKDSFISALFLGLALSFFVCVNCTEKTDYSSNILKSFTAKDSDITEISEINIDNEITRIWSVGDYNTAIQNSNFFKNHKLLSKKFMDKNFVDGEWQYNQVYYLDYLNRLNAANPIKLLINGEAYYISSNEKAEILLQYIKEHYNSNMKIRQISSTENIPIWEFYDN